MKAVEGELLQEGHAILAGGREGQQSNLIVPFGHRAFQLIQRHGFQGEIGRERAQPFLPLLADLFDQSLVISAFRIDCLIALNCCRPAWLSPARQLSFTSLTVGI